MDVSIRSAYPAPEASRGQISQQFSKRFGYIEKMAQRLSRRAALWMANRRVWSRRVTAQASEQTRLTGELAAVRREMRALTGVEVAIGAARSHGVARVASRMAGTAGVLVVARGQERAFLAPLPLRRLEGFAGAKMRVLAASGLVTIGELQRVPKAALQGQFGKEEGLRLWRAARGLDSEVAHTRSPLACLRGNR